jgi:hypothetical protein
MNQFLVNLGTLETQILLHWPLHFTPLFLPLSMPLSNYLIYLNIILGSENTNKLELVKNK